jgi:hypothetical protein
MGVRHHVQPQAPIASKQDAGNPSSQSLMLISIAHLKMNFEPGALGTHPGKCPGIRHGAAQQGDNPDCAARVHLCLHHQNHER